MPDNPGVRVGLERELPQPVVRADVDQQALRLSGRDLLHRRHLPERVKATGVERESRVEGLDDPAPVDVLDVEAPESLGEIVRQLADHVAFRARRTVGVEVRHRRRGDRDVVEQDPARWALRRPYPQARVGREVGLDLAHPRQHPKPPFHVDEDRPRRIGRRERVDAEPPRDQGRRAQFTGAGADGQRSDALVERVADRHHRRIHVPVRDVRHRHPPTQCRAPPAGHTLRDPASEKPINS